MGHQFVILERERLLGPSRLRDLQALPVLLGRLNGPAVRLDGPRETRRAWRGAWAGWLALAFVAALVVAGGC